MKIFFDLLPVLLFFFTFYWAKHDPVTAQQLASHYLSFFIADGVLRPEQVPILCATAMAILGTAYQVCLLKALRRKVDMSLWISLIVITVLGGATIWFHNELFIKWKPTILYACFALAIWGMRCLFKRNLIRILSQGQLQLPDMIWDKLNTAWIWFFVGMGVLNLWVAYSFSLETWVSFKLFGGMGLMFLFIIAQGLYLAPHLDASKRDKP